MNLQALHDELTNDPINRGYSGMGDEAALSDNEMRLVYEDSIRGYPNTLNWYRPSRYAVQDAGGGGGLSSLYSIFKPAVIRAA